MLGRTSGFLIDWDVENRIGTVLTSALVIQSKSPSLDEWSATDEYATHAEVSSHPNLVVLVVNVKFTMIPSVGLCTWIPLIVVFNLSQVVSKSLNTNQRPFTFVNQVKLVLIKLLSTSARATLAEGHQKFLTSLPPPRLSIRNVWAAWFIVFEIGVFLILNNSWEE